MGFHGICTSVLQDGVPPISAQSLRADYTLNGFPVAIDPSSSGEITSDVMGI